MRCQEFDKIFKHTQLSSNSYIILVEIWSKQSYNNNIGLTMVINNLPTCKIK